MKLSTRSRYGTRMVLDIAMHGGGGPVRISEVAQRQNVSVKYLEKLIRPLKKAKYISSRRGPKGGHSLSRRPEEITVGEIVRILEGDLALTSCVVNGKSCAMAGTCLTRDVWAEASRALYAHLDSITIADLIEKTQGCPDIVRAP